MDKSTLLLLEKLAYELGTTTECLWVSLLKQAHLCAKTSLLFFIIVIIVGILLFKLHKRLMKENKDEYSVFDLNGKFALPMIIGAISWAILFITSLTFLGDIINGFINPEYWALNKILNML